MLSREPQFENVTQLGLMRISLLARAGAAASVATIAVGTTNPTQVEARPLAWLSYLEPRVRVTKSETSGLRGGTRVREAAPAGSFASRGPALSWCDSDTSIAHSEIFLHAGRLAVLNALSTIGYA